MWNPLRRLITRVGQSDPLVLRHHPECTRYSHHTFGLYGQQVCMGCFIVYPVGFVSLSSLLLARLLAPEFPLFDADTLALYAAGLGLAGPKVVAKLLPGHRSHPTRVGTKVLLAVGLALVAFPFFFRPGARLSSLALFLGFLIPYVGYKALTAVDECKGCPYEEEFPNCPGMEFDGNIVDPERQYALESEEEASGSEGVNNRVGGVGSKSDRVPENVESDLPEQVDRDATSDDAD
jgi:hypothetical protein